MNDTTLILMTILAASNIVLIVFVVVPSILRQRRDRRFADSLQPVGSDGSSRDRTYSPANVLIDSPAPDRADALTGLLLPAEWQRIFDDEDARVRRYGRPATIVLIELDGIDRLTGALGQGAGDRVIRALADTLKRHARSADQLGRLGAGRLGVLLPETGEVEAVNYVERIRGACDLWLESGAIALRLAIGWAAPPADGTLVDALALAEERLLVELGRSARPVTDLPAPTPQAASERTQWPSTA